MNCTSCGAPLSENVKFCEQCGTPVAQESAAESAAEATQQAAAAAFAAGTAAQAGQQQYANYNQQQQGAYQQQAYQQQYQQPYQAYQPYAQVAGPSDTQRALAMLIYLSGLIGLIVALCVRDRNDPFITHHLNNVVVITIGSIIFSLLCIIIIGFIGLIFLFVVWLMGIIQAYNGEIKDLPLISSIKIIK